MSSNLGSGSKRKRAQSVPAPEELRRSARQKGKNNLPVIQRAMNIKVANNSLESDILNSTQNRSRANARTNVVQPTPAANAHTNVIQTAPANDQTNAVQPTPAANDQTNVVQPTPAANDQMNEVQPTPASIGQHIYQSGSHNNNSDDGWTTMAHYRNVNEERASCLDPLAPEFHYDLSNNKPKQSYIQSSHSQQPNMTDASRRTDHSRTAGLRHSIDQAAWSVQFVPHTASLNSQMMSYNASQRVIPPLMADSGNLINEAPQPGCSAPVDPNVQSSSNYRNLSSRYDSSRRVDHPVIADSCTRTNEAPQPSSSVPTMQNTQASLYQKLQCDVLLDASRRLTSLQGAGFHRFINQAARPVQFLPSFSALNSQMRSSDASQRVNQLIMTESRNHNSEAPRSSSNTAINRNMQALPYHQILSSQHGSSQRVGHPIMADSCNLNAPQPSRNNPTDPNMQSSLLYQMFSSQRGVPQQRQSSSNPIFNPAPNAIAVNQRYPSIGANSSQRNNYPDLDFITHGFNTGNGQRHRNIPRLDNTAVSNSQMNDSLSGDRSFALINSLNGVNLRISENDSSNNGRRSFTSILNSAYDAKTQLELEAEFRSSVLIRDQPQSSTEPNNLLRANRLAASTWLNDAKRVKHAHKEQYSTPPVITNHIRMEGGNPLSESPPQPKPLGERCRLCKIDLGFMARGANPQPSSSELPFAAVLPCQHAFHDQCLRDFFGDVEPPCVECLDSLASGGC